MRRDSRNCSASSSGRSSSTASPSDCELGSGKSTGGTVIWGVEMDGTTEGTMRLVVVTVGRADEDEGTASGVNDGTVMTESFQRCVSSFKFRTMKVRNRVTFLIRLSVSMAAPRTMM